VVAYGIAPGTVGAYYPEANVLVPLNYLDEESGTPSYKSVPVRLTLRSKEIRPLAGGR
jgi:anaerobic selenocysteine-containing dehydrogenase